MENFLVIKLLKSIERSELKQLRKFLESPYFNTNKRIIHLFNLLANYHPDFDSSRLKPEKICQKVFHNGKTFQDNAANFRTLRTQLVRLIQQFMVLEQLEYSEYLPQQLLLNAYLKKNVDADLIQKLTKTFPTEASKPDVQHYLHQFLIQLNLIEREERKPNVKLNPNHFAELNKNLDLFFTLNKIKLGIEHFNQKKRGNVLLPIHFLAQVKAFITKYQAELPQILHLYLALYEFIIKEEPSRQQFQSLFEVFKLTASQLPTKELDEVLKILYNFSNQKIRTQTELNYYRKARFRIMQLGLQYECFLQQNRIPSGVFMAIAVSGLALGENDWVDKFIQDFQELLPEETKKEDLGCTEAIVCYVKGHKSRQKAFLEEAINRFKNLKTKTATYLRKRIWYLLIAQYEYFLVAHDEGIFKYLDNIYNHVNRPAIFTEEQATQIFNTAKILKFLLKARFDPDFSLEKVQTRLDKMLQEPQFDLEWLDKMIAEFKDYRFPKKR